MKKTPTAIEERSIAEARLATVRATVEARAMEKTLALIESPQPVIVPWHEYPGFEQWNGGGWIEKPYIQTSPDDRTEGRYRPLYEDAQDVRRMRAEARRLVEHFPVARGALQKLSDYVMGTGWDFVVKPKKRYRNDQTAIQLSAIGQAAVDAFLEYNEFVGVLDREIHEESRIAGNVFPTLYPEDEQVRIVLTDDGCILEPQAAAPLNRMLRVGHKLNGWWHGVHTHYSHALKRDDVARPLGYHAVFNNTGDQWDYLPVSRVEHIKRNVGQLARVGVSDFTSVIDDLKSEAKVRRNTAEGAAILAAIVMIREHAPGVSKSSIESMVSNSATGSYEKPVQGGSRLTYGEQVKPGTIKDVPHGMVSTVGPMGQLRSPVYIEVAQYLLRIIGSPWSMPEYLISGDASNANYASTLVSESPFIKYCEHEQAFYAGRFSRLIWKALRMIAQCGSLRGQNIAAMQAMLDIHAEYESPASRDKVAQSQVNQTLHDAGIMSKRTWAADAGLDLDEELASGAAEKVEPPPVMPPFGGPPQQPMPLAPVRAAESVTPRLLELAERAMRSLSEGGK